MYQLNVFVQSNRKLIPGSGVVRCICNNKGYPAEDGEEL